MKRLTVRQIAARTGFNRSYIKAELVTGRLKGKKFGNQWEVLEKDFDKWIDNPRRGTRSD